VNELIRVALGLRTGLENCLVFHGAAPEADGEEPIAPSRNRRLASSFQMDAVTPSGGAYLIYYRDAAMQHILVIPELVEK
jgi:hypothetical protein